MDAPHNLVCQSSVTKSHGRGQLNYRLGIPFLTYGGWCVARMLPLKSMRAGSVPGLSFSLEACCLLMSSHHLPSEFLCQDLQAFWTNIHLLTSFLLAVLSNDPLCKYGHMLMMCRGSQIPTCQQVGCDSATIEISGGLGLPCCTLEGLG